MEPGQKSTAPKRHPLAFPTKIEKVEPKVVKIVKQPQVSNVEKEVAADKKQGNDILIVPTLNAEQKVATKSIPSESKVKELLGIKKEEPKQATEEKIQNTKGLETTTNVKVEVNIPKDPLIATKHEPKVDVLHANQKKNPQKHEAKNILLERSKIKTQIKPEIKAETKLEANNEMKAQVKSQIKEEIKYQPKEQIHKETKIQSKVEPKQEVKKQLKQQIKVHEKEQMKAQTKPEKNFQINDFSQSIGSKLEKKSFERYPVIIDIKDSTQKGSGLSKYTVYNITGEDNHGTIAISRKYEQFQSLSVILHERWPGCFVPALSKHSQIKNPEEKEKFKRVTLANFLIGLSYSSHIYYRQEVQLFLRSADVNVIEMFEKMPALKTRDVISRFKSSFGQDIQGPSTPAHTEFNSKFVASLRKIINNLGTLSLKALALSQAYDHYSQSMIKFGKVQKSYEQLCLSQYTDTNREKALLAKDNQNRIERLKQLSKHNPFYKLYSFLSNQAKDAESFLQVIIASELFVLRKDDLEVELKDLQNEIQAIMLGHKSLRTMTSRKTKEEVQAELEQKHKKLTEGKNMMIEIFSILEILLATKSIPLFKSFKRNNYKTILQEWVTFTSQTTPQIQAVWQFISEESKKCFKG